MRGKLDLLRQRSLAARYEKARRGELIVSAPIGFVKVGDRYEVIWVVGKAVPDLDDPLVSARAATAAIEQLVAMATRSHVRWVGLPRF
jgi:hypothetical protein